MLLKKGLFRKNLWKKKKMGAGSNKTTTHTEKSSSLHSFLLFKIFLIPLFSGSHDTLKAFVFRNNEIPLRIYLLEKIIR